MQAPKNFSRHISKYHCNFKQLNHQQNVQHNVMNSYDKDVDINAWIKLKNIKSMRILALGLVHSELFDKGCKIYKAKGSDAALT